MPTYQYRCTECDHEFEEFQSFTDDALTVCPACGGRLRKVFNAVGVVFKGSGFYRTDSRTAGSSSASGSSSTSGSSSPNGAGDGSSSDGGSKTSTSDSGASSSEGGGSAAAASSSSSSSFSLPVQHRGVVDLRLTLWRGRADAGRPHLTSGDDLGPGRSPLVPDRAA